MNGYIELEAKIISYYSDKNRSETALSLSHKIVVGIKNCNICGKQFGNYKTLSREGIALTINKLMIHFWEHPMKRKKQVLKCNTMNIHLPPRMSSNVVGSLSLQSGENSSFSADGTLFCISLPTLGFVENRTQFKSSL